MPTEIEVTLTGKVTVQSPQTKKPGGSKNGAPLDQYIVELTYSPQVRGYIQPGAFEESLASYRQDSWPPEQLAFQMAEAFANVVQSPVWIRLRSAKGDPPLVRVKARSTPEIQAEAQPGEAEALKGHRRIR